jgi:hypothetical protein
MNRDKLAGTLVWLLLEASERKATWISPEIYLSEDRAWAEADKILKRFPRREFEVIARRVVE